MASKWTKEYRRKYDREWGKLKRKGKTRKRCVICDEYFVVNISAQKRRYCPNAECKKEGNRYKSKEYYLALKAGKKKTVVIKKQPQELYPLSVNQKKALRKIVIRSINCGSTLPELTVSDVQREISPDKICGIMQNVISLKTQVIGLRGGMPISK